MTGCTLVTLPRNNNNSDVGVNRPRCIARCIRRAHQTFRLLFTRANSGRFPNRCGAVVLKIDSTPSSPSRETRMLTNKKKKKYKKHYARGRRGERDVFTRAGDNDNNHNSVRTQLRGPSRRLFDGHGAPSARLYGDRLNDENQLITTLGPDPCVNWRTSKSIDWNRERCKHNLCPDDKTTNTCTRNNYRLISSLNINSLPVRGKYSLNNRLL